MKIAIITHYYKSNNYGGNLQAYALVAFLKKYNLQAEQICANYGKYTVKKKLSICGSIKIKIKNIKSLIRKKIKEIYYKDIYNQINLRKQAFRKFNDSIPHSKKVYSEKTIKKSLNNYDVFITGSDQVWNLDWYYAPFFLDFVTSEKTKISYAASLGKNSLNSEQKAIFENRLNDFNAISVREQDAAELLKDISKTPVVCTLDPTLLLNQGDWNDICANRIVEEKYLFCYFLGASDKQRNLASEFAKKYNLKIVNIPHLLGSFRKCDNKFADINLYDIGPEKFISLIKYAEYIFTDSFHAAVFSGIYEKEYFVFERDGHRGMGSRIYTLLSLYECPERFCNTEEKESVEYIESLKLIDYTKKLKKLESLKEESMDYLKENLLKKKDGNNES